MIIARRSGPSHTRVDQHDQSPEHDAHTKPDQPSHHALRSTFPTRPETALLQLDHMYQVVWTGPAKEDLYTRVRSQRVALELVQVSRTALDTFDDDAGMTPPLYWRRGLTPIWTAESSLGTTG